MANKTYTTADSAMSPNFCKENVCHPQLLWPRFSIVGDGFDEKDEITFHGNRETMKQQRKAFVDIQNRHGFPPGSNTFWECFRLSTDILFADKFFKQESYKRMLWELQKAFKARDRTRKHIQIYCLDYFDDVKKLHCECAAQNVGLFDLFIVELRRLDMYNITHDRFAILDQEIWHCGASIGGMHRELSALSRGWKDEGDRLRDYFCGGNENDT